MSGVFFYRFQIPEDQLSPYGTRFWHSPYHLSAFFEARRAFSLASGITPQMHEEEKLTIVPVKATHEWFLPIFVPEGKQVFALIEVFPMNLGESSVTFGYKVYKEDDQKRKLRIYATVTIVFMQLSSGKAVPVPEWFRNHVSANI